MQVEYDPTTEEATFLILDETTETAVDMEQSVPGSSGMTADWIVERPTSGTDYTQLGNFGTAYIFAADGTTSGPAPDGSIVSPNSPDAEQDVMTNCARTETLATPSTPDSNADFEVYWENYGSVEPAGC